METHTIDGGLRAPLACLPNLAVFALALGLSFSVHAQNSGNEEPVWQPQVVIVQFEEGIPIAKGAAKTGLQVFDSRATQYQVYQITRAFPFLDHVQPTPKAARNLEALRRTYYVRYHASVGPRKVAKTLGAAKGVVYAEPVPIYRFLESGLRKPTEPNDSLFSEQTHLRHMRLPEAWDAVKGMDGNPPVVIAIADGGGDWRHEDLAANIWTNADEIPDNGIDDDNNGFIDDVHGVNFANGDDHDNDPTGLPATPFSARHGTAVAGVASAVSDNATGIAGAAWNAQLMHINVGCPTTDNPCYGYEGVLYAAANGANIINTSWGAQVGEAGTPQHVDQILSLAMDMGALVVASLGNSNQNIDYTPSLPAFHPRVLSVGATLKDSRIKAPFSSFGRTAGVFAPGVSINATEPSGGYTQAEGTSFSSPLVAGVAALVKTKFPHISADELREQVRMASENIDAQNPSLSGLLGRGYVNAFAAVQVPTLPAVRVKRWSWADSDGDGHIASGDHVAVTVMFVNHLADAQQLVVGLMPEELYTFIDMTAPEVQVGALNSGDSTEVTFGFTVASDALQNRRVRLVTRIREGSMEDTPDRLDFIINGALEPIYAGLSALYEATDGDNWNDNTNWDTTGVPTLEELLQWHGIISADGWPLGLNLPFNNLIGPMPVEIENLSALERLNLEFNRISGTLPPELGNLSQLRELGLNFNSFSGEIPAEIGNLSQLQKLWLAFSSFSGRIPAELGNLSQLRELGLLCNQLSGEIPAELGNLSQLQVLDLSDNSLSGGIPAELGNLPPLQQLWLDYNSLSGGIPAELGILSQLQVLGLSDNSLSGGIPPELGNLSQLTHLSLNENSFTGKLPRNFMQLTNLTVLRFGGQALCAPQDAAFQEWLSGLRQWDGNTCSGVFITTGIIDDQVYEQGVAITDLVLPVASGGTAPYTYTLAPAPPAGLLYDPSTRSLSGTPTSVTAPATYTYRVTDASTASDSLQFTIEVMGPVSREAVDELPSDLAMRGNYPNPFTAFTTFLFDLKEPAQVTVTVMDMLGRVVLETGATQFGGGRGHRLAISGSALPAGAYAYRFVARTRHGKVAETGTMLHVK